MDAAAKSTIIGGAFALLSSVAVATAVTAQEDAPAMTLFTNVHVFGGKSETRLENANVLVDGNLINTVSTDAIDVPGATVIDGGGRTLMPGLIDMHSHLGVQMPGMMAVEGAHWEEIAANTVGLEAAIPSLFI